MPNDSRTPPDNYGFVPAKTHIVTKVFFAIIAIGVLALLANSYAGAMTDREAFVKTGKTTWYDRHIAQGI